MLKLTLQQAQELGEEIKLRETGSLTPCLTADEVEWGRNFANGHNPRDVRYVEREEALKIEPALSRDILGALYQPKLSHCNPKHFL